MKDILDRLRVKGVHTLLAQFTDMLGVTRGKLVPLAHFDELLTDGVGFTGATVTGAGLPRTGSRSDYHARGNASTVIALPWMPGVARVVCDGFVNGQPFDACPRQVLRRAMARLHERGWHLRTGIEPEFVLLRRHEGGWLPAEEGHGVDNISFDLRSLTRQHGFLQALQTTLVQCGLDVQQIGHGDALAQYELKLGFGEALASADDMMLLRQAASSLAEERAMVCSMMPKPFDGQPGSGMHLHVSLWSAWNAKRPDNAHNLFVPHRADGSINREQMLSPLGDQFVAGVLAHSAALTALAAPTVNSYKRLHAGASACGANWAPRYVAQGPNNRTAAIRTRNGRFEWRVPDASANPYLVTAVLIAAGLDGIDRKLDKVPDCTEDLYDLSPAQLEQHGYARLPRTLAEALDALADDEVVRMALGESLSSEFLRIKYAEAAAYARHVSDWEMQHYATAF